MIYYISGLGADERVFKYLDLGDLDYRHIKWAIEEIMNWNGNSTNKNIVHIHGDNDKVFPVNNINNFIRIKDGGHFMIVNKANEISEIIINEIKMSTTHNL